MNSPAWKLFIPLLPVVIIGIFLGSCRKEEFSSSPDHKLEFSMDTVLFDTVFTTVGSTTKILKVYNRNGEDIKTHITLDGEMAGSYKLNVNGTSGTLFENVEIPAKDSIFIFVEVMVDPNGNENYPYVDGLLHFNTNGNSQEVKLVAWGWDAIFYYPNTFPLNGLPNYRLISGEAGASVEWNSEKPIVIYGYVVVDEGQKLTIGEGTQVFFHANAGLWVYQGGQISVEGTIENPVMFQGDRLEVEYDELSGQWDRIWINEGSQNNSIKNAIIKNGFIGIQAEPLPFGENADQNSTNKLVLENVQFRNHTFAGLYCRNYKIDAKNCLIGAAGSYSLAVSGGGEYRFNHCTIANWGTGGIRNTPAFFMSNAYSRGETAFLGVIQNSVFYNCIISGNTSQEFALELYHDFFPQDVLFSHCQIRMDGLTDPNQIPQLNNCYIHPYPGFINLPEGDLKLVSDAFAIGKGTDIVPSGLNVNSDIIGNPYSSPPALGCYEYFE